MLLSLLARFTPLHEAKSAAEREAIYRFRYSIYGKELRREYPGNDPAREMLAQTEDELPESRLWYTGTAKEITATSRARVWERPPPEVVEELSLQRVPPMKIAYLERTMVRPTLRGRLLFASILWHGYERLMQEGVELCVLTCVPGLARHYVRLGARPYGARLVEGASSAELPLMIVMNDVAHLERVGSFMYPRMKALARPYDPAPLLPLFTAPQPVTFEPEAVTAELLRTPSTALAGLSPASLRRLARGAFILEIEPGELLVRKGTADREMYVVLQGELSVEGGARIGPGEPMGEMAFLGTPGLRTATVHASQPSRLLVLRRRFLDELAKTDLHAAYTVARNLARVAADRFFAERART
ncbi:MAG TPA: cyclic nucleotide-binding domain-containing protein [Myxococcales bacterium]|nr:cyclic nucleotide-binding domain-containing protein [Myxococcales bacterium]